MTSNRDNELIPCPWCEPGNSKYDGEANILRMDYGDGYHVYGVFCRESLERDRDGEPHPGGHYIDNCATEDEAIAEWNNQWAQRWLERAREAINIMWPAFEADSSPEEMEKVLGLLERQEAWIFE